VFVHLTDSSVLRYVRVRAHASCLRESSVFDAFQLLTRHKLILGLFYPVRGLFCGNCIRNLPQLSKRATSTGSVSSVRTPSTLSWPAAHYGCISYGTVDQVQYSELDEFVRSNVDGAASFPRWTATLTGFSRYQEMVWSEPHGGVTDGRAMTREARVTVSRENFVRAAGGEDGEREMCVSIDRSMFIVRRCSTHTVHPLLQSSCWAAIPRATSLMSRFPDHNDRPPLEGRGALLEVSSRQAQAIYGLQHGAQRLNVRRSRPLSIPNFLPWLLVSRILVAMRGGTTAVRKMSLGAWT
jgi:hypothetical protein